MNQLSVVIIAQLGGEALEACLTGLGHSDCDCLVVLPDQSDRVGDWTTRFPAVRFLTPEQRPVPLRRLQGLSAAKGDIIAFLEDTSRPSPGWCHAICESFADKNVAGAGGPVEISGTLPARYKALACSEFGRFHPKRYLLLARGARTKGDRQPVSRLPGNNLAYRREILTDLIRDPHKGIFETEINESIVRSGMDLVINPGMAVTYMGIDQHGALLSTRMNHGRLFASGCVLTGGVRARITGFVKSLILPLVLSVRSLTNAWSVVEPSAFPKVALWLCAIESSWALGEGVGYMAGAGDSLESWQ